MNLTNKQIQTQEAMLLLIHKTDDIEEAKRKELKLWCLIMSWVYVWKWGSMPNAVIVTNPDHNKNQYWNQISPLPKCSQDNFSHLPDYIIWLPPTLERVLHALGRDNWRANSHICNFWGDTGEKDTKWICRRQLLKEDWTPASLRDQPLQTQDMIHDLIVKK